MLAGQVLVLMTMKMKDVRSASTKEVVGVMFDDTDWNLRGCLYYGSTFCVLVCGQEMITKKMYPQFCGLYIIIDTAQDRFSILT